jgi:hypothetical protein
MKYTIEEKTKIIQFLEQAKKLVESGDICEYKIMTNNYHLLFEVTKVNKHGNAI